MDKLDITDADIYLDRDFLPDPIASKYFDRLRTELNWRQDTIGLFGKAHQIPRLHDWHGDPGLSYRWSGITMAADGWHPALLELRDALAHEGYGVFNSVLANLYRDGDDCMGWHSDDEPELGKQPTLASISLGATRDFRLRHRESKTSIDSITLPLTHGSLLLMAGNTQQYWQHSLPRRKRSRAPRINLTFRSIAVAAKLNGPAETNYCAARANAPKG